MKQFDLQGNEYDIQIKEMLDNIPETNNLVSAYGSINIDDLQKAMNRLKKVPTYDELLKENKKQKEVLDKIKEYVNKEISLIDKDLSECELTYSEKYNFENNKSKYISILELLEEIEWK